MAFVDYRPKSYRRIARGQRISRSLREQAREQQSQAEVSQEVSSNVLSSENVVENKSVSSVKPLASALFKQEVKVSDVLSGKVKRVSDVGVSGGVGSKLSRESDKPMSVREDVVYKSRGKVLKPEGVSISLKTPNKSVKQNGNVVDNNRNNILGNFNDESLSKDKEQKQVPKFFEKQVKFIEGREKAAAERSKRLSDFGESVITSSPFRKTNEPLGFWEQVGAKGLTSPAKILVEYPEQTLITVGKAGVFAQGLLFEGSRKGTVEEGKRAAGEFVPSVKAGFDLGTPTGVVNVATTIAAPSFIKQTIDIPKGAFIKAGSKKVATEQVFSRDVLSGKETLPLSGSVKESVVKFESTRDLGTGKIYAQTSSPAKITGNVAGVGKKAKLGLEDTGIYVTPKGQGSPYFLRVDGSIKPSYSFSFNPVKGIFDQPTVTVFGAEGIVTLPRSVISKPGFKAVESFQRSDLAGKGVLQITKRSELGQGSIPVDYSIKGKAKFGTSELVAVVPAGQSFV
jgi:hypothetical protein